MARYTLKDWEDHMQQAVVEERLDNVKLLWEKYQDLKRQGYWELPF